jgi:hypothetical protein
MPMSKQSVTLTKPDANTVQIAIGPETYTLAVAEIKSIWNGSRDVSMLIFQFHVALQAAGVNPNTATAAQMKAAIEAQTYWWGN